MTKLFIVSALPIIALTLFPLLHFYNKYDSIQMHDKQLLYSKIIKNTNELIHQLRLEKGLSFAYMSKISHVNYFKKRVDEQLKFSDQALKDFNTILSISMLKSLNKEQITLLSSLREMLEGLKLIRASISNNDMNSSKVFNYFTKINETLIDFLGTLRLHSSDKKIATLLDIKNHLMKLNEYSSKERAFITSLPNTIEVNLNDLKKFYTLISMQDDRCKRLTHAMIYDKHKNKLISIHKLHRSSYFNEVREEIQTHEKQKKLLHEILKIIGYGGMTHNIIKYQSNFNQEYYNVFLSQKKIFDKLITSFINSTEKSSDEYKISNQLNDIFIEMSNDKHADFDETEVYSLYKLLSEHPLHINSKEWFKSSSQRIDSLHEIENEIIDTTIKLSLEKRKALENSLFLQILFSTIVILTLLAGTYLVSKQIKKSINSLNTGLNNLFDFLNFKKETSKLINDVSSDEIGDMQKMINSEISLLSKNLEDDKDFINEAIQIVALMKDGNFSEKLYFHPHNPYLLELKNILDELIALISTKIKEQTYSLEALNSSLEDKVFHQTNKLHEQVQEMREDRDKAIEAEKAKDDFLANMSHEIRTPLNAILGFVNLLKKRISDEKSQSYLHIIDNSSNSLLTIINDILDFSKIESGKFIITKEDIDPVDEISNSLLLFASKAYEKNIYYSTYVDPNMPKLVSVDIVRIKQIVSNILSNAIKFTQENGQINVKASMENEHISISVTDNGIGISKENIKKVFGKFEQADGTTTRKYGGTGLGLSISSRLAELMDGTLTCESELNVGTTFKLSIPTNVVDAQHKVFLDATRLNEYTFALLSCNDHSMQIKLIKQYLQEFGIDNIIEMNEYENDGYDLLFFTPDDDYNEEIVNSRQPSIALLNTSTIKLADLEHIIPLYAPLIPRSIVESINDSAISSVVELKEVKEEMQHDDTVQFSGSVLVAEDNKTNQMLISILLDDYGLDYKIANNGVEAVEMFKDSKFDLILMDENMPKLNGIGAMKQIKQHEMHYSLIAIPIVALTASVMDTDKEKFLNAGMDDFVAKPINVKELENVLSKYLKRG